MARRENRTVIGKALDAEQARLMALPHVEPEDDDDYGGRLVLDECHYSGEEPEAIESYSRRAETKMKYGCRVCHLSMAGPGPMILHSRPLPERDQVREIVATLAEVLGMERWSDAVSNAAYEAERSRPETLAGKLAVGLPLLTAALIRQDAMAGSAKVMKELTELTLDSDEHPFYSEATLYELLGKDDARTVLYTFQGLQRTMGSS